MLHGGRLTGDIVTRLRVETRVEHDAIELALDWEARTADRLRYRRWLERLYGWHRGWEPAVAAAVADPALVEPRRKLALLRDDLGRLGAGAGAIEALPAAPVPAFADAAAALGSMYVIEGSTLGGRLIARRVAAELGFAPAYHGAYGAASGAMWRGFQAALRARVAPADEEAVVAGARATFVALRGWLARD